MDTITGGHWREVFDLQTPVLEVVARGTIMYLGLFVLMRVVLKRQPAGLGITDLLVVVLIADAAQNGMSGDYRSISDGLLLVATIVFWAYALDWLGFHVAWFERLVGPSSLPLVEDGRLLRRNMRRELITEDELLGQLRLAGVDDVAQVKRASMEGDGGISVVRADAEPGRRRRRPRRA